MLKNRNPLLHWFFVMLTGGLYAFVWNYRIAADVNKITESKVIDIRKNVSATFILLVAYLFVFIFGLLGFQKQMEALRAGGDVSPSPSPLIFVGFTIGLALLMQLIYLMIRSARAVRETKGIEVPTNAVLVVLTFAYFISLPLLQSKINKIGA